MRRTLVCRFCKEDYIIGISDPYIACSCRSRKKLYRELMVDVKATLKKLLSMKEAKKLKLKLHELKLCQDIDRIYTPAQRQLDVRLDCIAKRQEAA